MQAPGLMCFRSATEGQKAFLRKNKKGLQDSLDSEARREPERQRDQGQLESERRGWGEAEPDWTGRVSGGWWQSWIWTCDLNGRSSVGRSGMEEVQAQSPTTTRGARSLRSSAADTGPPLGWLPRCLRQASLELEGGESCMEEPAAVTTNGTSCCWCWSSMPSCSASCRFTAMALSAKNVKSLALLVLLGRKRGTLGIRWRQQETKVNVSFTLGTAASVSHLWWKMDIGKVSYKACWGGERSSVD